MSHSFINNLEAGNFIEDIYMVSQPVLRHTTRGDLYIAMFLSDKTGKANCRIWNASEDLYKQIPKEGFVHIQGKTELYQGNIQLVVNRVSPVESKDVNLEDFLKKTEKDVEQMYAEVVQMLAAIKNEKIKALIEEFMRDKKLMENFKIAPAAIRMHHDYLGGLLEHTHTMLSAATRILPLYPKVQADLVLAGIFLHDIAKTEELRYELAFGYTNTGQLIGHLVQGAIMIDQKADMLLDRGVEMDRDMLDSLIHIILSHHGKYEFGSPKLPATSEAIMVNYIDDLDAKMNFVADAVENDNSDEDWTSWKPSSVNIGTKFFKKRVTD